MTIFSLQKKLHTAAGIMTLDVNCEMEDSAFISLYGPSGAGKTSLLRMLAGFMKPDAGFIKVKDEIWFDSEAKINVPPQQRLVGFVFQDYALFPNMNVEENISFAAEKIETGVVFLVLAGNQLIKIIGTENDCKNLQKGDSIIVSFKDATAFLRKL